MEITSSDSNRDAWLKLKKMSKSQKDCQGEVMDLFQKLASWKEESQRQFSNIMNFHSTSITNGISGLVGEFFDLKAQLSVTTKERDDLK